MKTFKLTITEDEMRAIIVHHAEYVKVGYHDNERSERIHTLTKRLNKDTPEIEDNPRPKSPIGGLYDDPFPNDHREPAEATAAKEEQPASW